MILKDIKAYLINKLNLQTVYCEKPTSISGETLVLSIKDERESNHLRYVTIAVYCYADTKIDACILHEDVIDAMLSADLEKVSSVRFTSGTDDIDTSTKKYCFKTYFNLTL